MEINNGEKMKKVVLNEKRLMDELKIRLKLSVDEAVQFLGVSPATARRLFVNLEKKGKAIRIFGGIQLIEEGVMSYSFEQFKTENIEAKRKIGECAAGLVTDNSVIYIDSGTTTVQFSRYLLNRLKHKELKGVSIFTNSIENLNVFSGKYDVNLIGGTFRLHRKDFYGYLAESSVKKIHFTDCFLGTDGISGGLEFMTTDFDTAALNEAVIERSEQIYILADASKFQKISFTNFCHAAKNKVTVISDHKIKEQQVALLLLEKTHLIIAE